jgi:hypothetical protein
MGRLTPDQAQKIHDAIGPALGYLARLVERTDRPALRHGDPKLYRLVQSPAPRLGGGPTPAL